MTRLFMLLLSIAMTSFAGIGVIAVLVAGHYSAMAILLSAGAGALLALPAAWAIARKMGGGEG